jgi:predicted porin
MAQNVTVGGNIDTSTVFASSNASSKGQTLVSAGLISTPTLSIKGNEDLGSGLKAFVIINSRMGTDEPITTATSTTITVASTTVTASYSASAAASSAFTLGDRGMLVGVSGSFGTVAIGRSDGSAMNGLQGGFLGNRSLLGAVNIRPDNSISYESPTMNGASVRVLHSVGNETAATPADGALTELSLKYAMGPVGIKLAKSKLGNNVIRNDVGGGSASNSAADDVDQTGIAVDYNAGFAKINFRAIKSENASGVTGNATVVGTNTGVGLLFPIGSGLDLAVDYMKQDRDTKIWSSTSATVGLIKNLSKRTNVYGLYQIINNDSSATAGPLGVTAAAGADNNAFAVGIRHTF